MTPHSAANITFFTNIITKFSHIKAKMLKELLQLACSGLATLDIRSLIKWAGHFFLNAAFRSFLNPNVFMQSVSSSTGQCPL